MDGRLGHHGHITLHMSPNSPYETICNRIDDMLNFKLKLIFKKNIRKFEISVELMFRILFSMRPYAMIMGLAYKIKLSFNLI